ncbi:MAG TPA: tyrosine--tRNA ligase, partial [Candidatus Margulisiibacteriota bacterium]|nr:tyrosine--tRNA ligase [Candidatus Margulisiibacteriota bacterium]
LGGTDQLFNLLAGRELMEKLGMEPQVALTLPLLEGTDGVQKMSKSYGNYIGINEPAKEIFGKVMSISDELMYKYFTLLTDENLEEVKRVHPKEAKLLLAELITATYHGKEAGRKERDSFQQTFSKKETPDDIPSYQLKKGEGKIVDILIDSGLTASKNEARRLINQGGVYLDGERLKEDALIEKGGTLKVGKHRFLQLKI